MLVANNHVGLVVRDLEGMVRFYTEVLGLKVHRRVVFPQIEIVYLGVTADEVQVELLKPKDEGQTPGLAHLCFEVADIRATVEVLKERGAPFFVEPTLLDDKRGWLAWLRDPEGTPIELIEPAIFAMYPGLFGEQPA